MGYTSKPLPQKHRQNELHILKHDLAAPDAGTMFHSLHFGGVAVPNDLVYGLCMHLTTQKRRQKTQWPLVERPAGWLVEWRTGCLDGRANPKTLLKYSNIFGFIAR